MQISESEGGELVESYRPYFAECHWQGWDNYFKKYQKVLHDHLPQNRSDLINREINLAAKTILSAVHGIRLDPRPHGQYWVIIRDLAVVRFKKLDSLFRPSWNHGTRQSRRISRQLPIPGYPDYAWLNAGYIPNKLWSDIEAMYIVHPRSETSIGWKISLMGDPQLGIDFDFPSVPPRPVIPEPPTPTRPPRARWQPKEGEAIPKEQTHEPAR